MTFLGCATSEEDGSNFTPPTLGEFMKKRTSEEKILRESRATARVVKEGRLFHEKQALKHGIETERGLAHLRAARMFSREAGMKLQEEFEQGGGAGQLNPKAVMKANKAAMGFHKKQAEKAGIDSDLGRAHTGAMEHHMAICKNAKQQMQQQPQGQMPPQQEAGVKGMKWGQHIERGGSGFHKAAQKLGLKLDKGASDSERLAYNIPKKGDHQVYVEHDGSWSHEENPDSSKNYKDHGGGGDLKSFKDHFSKFMGKSKEALPGASGKQSPLPVPNKKDQPNQDVRMPVPPVPLQKLQQNEAWGPKYTASRGWGTPMKASKRMRRIDRFGEGLDKGYNPSTVNKQLDGDKIFYGKKPKPMKDNSELTTKEANEDGYVEPRYQNIKPEGEISPRDFPKSGSESTRKPMTMEGKRGWTERQRSMHSRLGKRIARKS